MLLYYLSDRVFVFPVHPGTFFWMFTIIEAMPKVNQLIFGVGFIACSIWIFQMLKYEKTEVPNK